MPRPFRLQSVSTTKRQRRAKQRGYMLITMMLALALMTLALLASLPQVGQQIQRDREEELRHRGTAYMRAIRLYYRRFGRYPSRVDELENTDNIRFLRKRYRDPMSRDPATGKEKDFTILRQADILGTGLALPGQNGSGGASGSNGLPTPGGVGGVTQAGPGSAAQTGGGNDPTPANADSGDAEASGYPSGGGSPPSDSNGAEPTFGGGPILGVASTSKAKTIRMFFGKNHYNDWLFIYVQGIDRGGQMMGPVNPSFPTANLDSLNRGQPVAGVAAPGPGQGQGSMAANSANPAAPQPQPDPAQTPLQP
jgi:type II secretory pathway pseudopilin PulG